MEYQKLKEKMLSMFDREKLEAAPAEWGIYNESRHTIGCIGYATNITPEVIKLAYESGVELLLTHHDSWDFVFGLKEICNQLLEEYGMVHAFFHAPLDDAEFGTSASLAKALGIVKEMTDMPYMEVFQCGVIGELPPISIDEFSKRLSDILGEPIRCFQNSQRPVQKAAVVTGGGNMTGEMQRAVEHGCDTYVTGEYVLYSQQYAKLHNMNLLVGSHTNTEILGVESMAKLMCQETDIRLVRIEEPGY